MSKNSKLVDSLVPKVMKFVNLKGIVALREGMMAVIPLTLVGSIFLLLAQLPIPALNNWLTSILGPGWVDPLFQIYGATFAIIALVTCFSISYFYVKNEGYEPLMAGVWAIVAFLATINGYVIAPNGDKISKVIPKAWIGGQGMVTAIIIGLIVGVVYSWFLKKGITIKMPEGVPQGVVNAFTSLIPGMAIATGCMFVFILFKSFDTTLIEWIYKVLQVPLMGASDSLGGLIISAILISLFWWFGVHGATIVNSVMKSLWLANTAANQAILDSGEALTIANGAKIVTVQFIEQFVIITGSGITIGIVIGMLFFAKSAQSKKLGKLSIVPSLFNINEPVTFGFPIVMNPFMFIPFILVPLISGILSYFAIASGLVPPFSGVMVPWTTPPIISGLLLGGWRTALMQLVCLAVSALVYFPFFLKQDAINLKNEQKSEVESV